MKTFIKNFSQFINEGRQLSLFSDQKSNIIAESGDIKLYAFTEDENLEARNFLKSKDYYRRIQWDILGPRDAAGGYLKRYLRGSAVLIILTDDSEEWPNNIFSAVIREDGSHFGFRNGDEQLSKNKMMSYFEKLNISFSDIIEIGQQALLDKKRKLDDERLTMDNEKYQSAVKTLIDKFGVQGAIDTLTDLKQKGRFSSPDKEYNFNKLISNLESML